MTTAATAVIAASQAEPTTFSETILILLIVSVAILIIDYIGLIG